MPRAIQIGLGALACLFLAGISCLSQVARPTQVAVLDFGNERTGLLAAGVIAQGLAARAKTSSVTTHSEFEVVDRDQSRAAALGAGYRGSLNMTVQAAKDLGAAIGCDFYFVGEAQTVRRSPSSGAGYYESYASIFLVSGRTGRLVLW